MRVMIFAAGRGERLRPLTDSVPKPLIRIGEDTLIERHLKSLARSGLHDIIINTSWLAEQLHNQLGDGSQYGVQIHYSDEGEHALETGGGIVNALDLLGSEPFMTLNADIVTDYPWDELRLSDAANAHLVMVDNPYWHPEGDFRLENDRLIDRNAPCLTFSGIAVYRPQLFHGLDVRKFSVVPLLECAMAQGQVSGEHYRGLWHDAGSPERLRAARQSQCT